MISEGTPAPFRLTHSTESFVAFCRWFSALIVLLSHTRALMFVGIESLSGSRVEKLLLLPLYVLGSLSDEAVIVFFVLSGFLVGGRAVERALGQRFTLRDYTIDRSTRIYCVMIPAMLLTLAFDRAGNGWFGQSGMYDWTAPLVKERFLRFEDTLNAPTFLCNVLQAQPYRCGVFGSNVPLWSLSYEVWFYICAGVLCFWLTKRSVVRLLAFLVAVAAMVAALGWSAPVYALFWISGAAVYLLSRQAARFQSRALVWLANLGCVAAIVGCSRIPYDVYLGGRFIAYGLVGTSLAFSATLYIHANSRLPSSERLRTLNLSLSDFSYSLYIVHFPIVVFLLSILLTHSNGLVGAGSGYQPTRGAMLPAYMFVVAVPIGIAWLFSRVFEKGSWWVRQQLKAALR